MDITKKVFIATSATVPQEGSIMLCNKLNFKHGYVINHEPVRTSMVLSVESIGENTYKVSTLNSIYIVTVC